MNIRKCYYCKDWVGEGPAEMIVNGLYYLAHAECYKQAMAKEGKMKYTVVGYWRDNNQPWVEWAEAETPKEAAQKAVSGAESSDDLVVVDVFEGHHMGKLKNETVMPYEEVCP